MATKHEQTIRYIESMPIGEQLSVRVLAKELDISEGTAYRAIKEAENKGLVSTIERVGTIRIEKRNTINVDQLTYADVIKIIDGRLLGGKAGLDKHLKRFIIGAMEESAVQKYISEETLLIVGNRSHIQRLALVGGAAVLITGGFEADDEIIELANQNELPVISTKYDTFTVASMINRSMKEQQIKEELLLVSDIYTPIEKTKALLATDTIADFHKLANETGLSRFPVVTGKRLIGIVTAKDLIGRPERTLIERVMTKNVITAKLHMSLANVSYQMVLQDIEMLPIVADNLDLLGTVSRQDVMKALHNAQEEASLNQTYVDEISSTINELDTSNKYQFKATVEPHMINNLGNLSYGVLCEWLAYVAQSKIYQELKQNSIIEKLDLHYFNNLQIGNDVEFVVDVFNHNRRNALVEVDLYHQNVLSAKAIITCQLLESP